MSQEVIEITEREIEIIEVVERGPAGPSGPQANINYTVVSSPQTLSNSQNIAADTSGGSFTLTLPANPNAGDSIDIFDYSETFDTNPLTIARNGQRIESLEENLICNVEGAYFTMIYTGSTRGWQILPRYGTSGGGGESILTNQGDTLYRGALVNERLPIGTAGQILKVNSGATAPEWGAAPATGVTSVTGTAPIASSGGATPAISISAATTSAAGSMSSADKTKLDGIATSANNYTHPNHSGEVTSSGDGATTIANDAVTNAKLANMATATIKGRATASTGDPEDLSASQVRTILNVADGAEVNVQSNWTEANSGSDAFILNKPTLGTAAAAATTDFAAAVHTHAAADVTSGTFDNARINFAAPAAIGNTTPNTLAGTQLALHDGSDMGTFVAASKLTANRTYDLPDASGTIALTAQLTDTQIFTANGTWTKPAGAKMLQVELVGGGGGGGGGRRGAAGTARGGGGGGAGAGHTVLLIDPESLSATETVTVGAGGVGGTAAGNDTNGGAGAAGGDTTFGPLKAFGGNGGAGGNNTAQAGGGASASVRGFIINSSHSTAAGGNGGYEATSAGAGTGATSAGNIWPASGGGGSRITSANALTGAGGGGAIGSGSGGVNPHSALGGAAPNVGNKGITGSRLGFIGAGASGGRQGSAGEGAEGGDAILGGGGGGGAGATNDAGGSNAGGKGGDGIAVITTYF